MTAVDIPDAWRERARELAEAASHDSVTVDILTGGGRFANEFYLYDKPLVAHFDDDERPHFAFHNQRKGISVGSKRNAQTPDSSGIATIAVTDRRVLAVVGRRAGDERLTIPYRVVTGASAHSGLMKHRIAVETTDRDYHLWIDSGYDESSLREATTLIEDEISGEDAPSPDGSTTSLASSDGGADPSGATGSTATTRRSTDVEATDAGRSPADRDENRNDDPLETLERLQELHEQGVLTDEEFQEKKSDLLDQI